MSNDPATALIAIVVVLLLALVLRWVFRPSRPRTGVRPVDATDSPNLGLLTVLVTRLSRQDALTQRARLAAAQIRSSMSARHDGTMDLLVFHADLERARGLLGL